MFVRPFYYMIFRNIFQVFSNYFFILISFIYKLKVILGLYASFHSKLFLNLLSMVIVIHITITFTITIFSISFLSFHRNLF